MQQKPDRTLIAGFVAAAGAMLLFGWLAGVVWRGQTLEFDHAVRDFIHRSASPRLTYAMRGITWLGAPSFLIPLSLVLVWRLAVTGRHRAAVLFVIAAVGAEVLEQLLKLVFRRARPEAFFGYEPPHGYGFPSGHSVVSACCYGVAASILTLRMRSPVKRALTWLGAAILAATIGISRIYLGVHYPSDVLAGFATAIIWVATVRAGYEIWRRRRAPKDGTRE